MKTHNATSSRRLRADLIGFIRETRGLGYPYKNGFSPNWKSLFYNHHMTKVPVDVITSLPWDDSEENLLESLDTAYRAALREIRIRYGKQNTAVTSADAVRQLVSEATVKHINNFIPELQQLIADEVIGFLFK